MPGTSTIPSNWSSRTDSLIARAGLFLRLLGFVRLLHDERFYARRFLLEPVNEVMRAVFEEDDEAKGEENKKYEPKESA
jgi:hypothetical protein